MECLGGVMRLSALASRAELLDQLCSGHWDRSAAVTVIPSSYSISLVSIGLAFPHR